MAEQDINRKILIDIQSRVDKSSSEVVDLNKQLDDLLVKQTRMKGANQQNTQSYAQLNAHIRNTKQAIRDKNKELDNSFKAMAAENDSIVKNRALLSVMTADYIKLSQEQGKTSKSTIDLKNKIDSLTETLKKQEKPFSTSRNVGNYDSAFEKFANNIAGKYIPGFNQFSSILGSSAQNFGKLGKSAATSEEGIEGAGAAAAGAGEGMEGAAVGVGGLVMAFLAIVGIIAVVIQHFAALTPNADSLAQRFAYLKGAVRAFLDDIFTGKGFSELGDDMAKTAQEAANLKMALQDLARAQQQDIVDDAKADAQIAELQLKMRNRRNTVEQEKSYFNQIQKISEDKYKGNLELANKEYELAVRTATNSTRFSEDEKKRLMKDGVDYAIILDKTKGLINGEDDIKAIVAAQQKQIATQREKEMIAERSQNRLDSVEMRAEQAAEKEKQMLLELQQAYNEQVSQRTESYQRMLELQQDAFGRELSQTAEHYRQLLFKEQEFILKQQKIRDDKKSTTKERAAASRNIGAAGKTITQIESEQYIATEKLLVDHNRSVLEETAKAGLDLKNLQIGNISDVHAREVAAANNSYEIKKGEMDKEDALLQQQRRNITKQLEDNDAKAKNDKTRYSAEQIQALKTDLNGVDYLIGVSSDKRIALEKFTTKQLLKINRDYQHQLQSESNKADVLVNKRYDGKGPTEQEHLAQRKQISDQYDFEISEAKRNNLETVGLEAAKNDALLSLNEQYYNEKLAKAMAVEKEIQANAMGILKQSINDQSAKQLGALSLAKTTELNNQALTKTQIATVNEKYRKQELAVKVKAFKANQKADIAEAIVNGALAMTKVAAQTGVLSFAFDPIIAAETAVSIAKIAAQQPPSYARGTGPVHSGNGKVRGPGTGTSDSIPARLSNGESVINAKSTSMFGSLLSAINVAGGGVPFAMPNFTGRFATGGVSSSTYVPTVTNNFTPALPTITHLSDQSVGDIVNGIAGVQIITDVKDVNNQQAIRAKVMDRTVL